MNQSSKFYSHGKLLLSGEYFVLNGAKALAIPTCFGQHLEIESAAGNEGKLFWRSLDEKGDEFLSVIFDLTDFNIVEKRGKVPHYLLQDALRGVRKLQKDFLKQKSNVSATARLEFSLGWGLGSSSTLIHNIALWAQADAFDLFFSLLHGSGYDIACAGANKAITYQLNDHHAVWNEIDFLPPFAENILFVYLGKKQNSQQAVRQYLDNVHDPGIVRQISSITDKMISSTSVEEFMSLMKKQEAIIASALRLERVQERFFSEFPGAVKSLGAWGGDFVMACSAEKPNGIRKYFDLKGYKTSFDFKEIIFAAE